MTDTNKTIVIYNSISELWLIPIKMMTDPSPLLTHWRMKRMSDTGTTELCLPIGGLVYPEHLTQYCVNTFLA